MSSLDKISNGLYLNKAKETENINAEVKRLNIKISSPAQLAGKLSGGNQQKAIVAREIDKEHELLIAVQPTRGLDVGAIEYIHKKYNRFRQIVQLISKLESFAKENNLEEITKEVMEQII